MGNKCKLSVMIPTRDRTILTQKCIDSIWKNSSVFHRIDIYVFDNLSEITQERTNLFSKMLKSKKICYYSYDSSISSHLCFGKASTFMRWCQMMEIDYRLKTKVRDYELNYKNFYLLLDNDFIVGPRWGEYFISAWQQISQSEKHIHYLVPYPGGIPDRFRNDPKTPEYEITNNYNEEEKFKVKMASWGGSSGFWFTRYDGLMKLKWNISTLAKTFCRHKKQDSETWIKIRRELGTVNYVGAVRSPKEPLALHLGSLVGSICNKLVDKKYDKFVEEFLKKESSLSNLTVEEIYEKCKDSCKSW